MKKGVRRQESGVRIFGVMFAVSLAVFGQGQQALMSSKDVNQLCQRSVQLMEAGGIAIPELQRAAAPMIETVKQACVQLQAQPEAGETTFSLMMNVRAYLAIADSVPKPFPFPEAARQQISELRDASTRLDSHFRALLDAKDAQLTAADPDDLARYAEANRKLPSADSAKPRVVFLGDSITDRWRVNEYFPDRDFINRGIAGQTSGQMLDRMKADVIDLHPAAVVIQAGANDLAQQIPLTTIENNYVMMVDLASLYKIKVIFASVLPVSDYHKDMNHGYEQTRTNPTLFINALNDWIERLCSQRGYTYLNYSAAMADGTDHLKEDLSDDGLLPNAKGYRVMAPLALAAVESTVLPARTSSEQPRQKRGRRRATSK